MKSLHTRIGLIILLGFAMLIPGRGDYSFAQAPVGVDLALVIDGSGSISSVDFALQKEGIQAALKDPLVVPRDGSVAMTVIQYGSATTRIEVPYTEINGASEANDLIAQVANISQIGGSTNPGDGINTSMGVLNADGNPLNSQTICLSTDGLPNSGADVPTAVADAQASPIALDRFTVVAIEDPPNYYAADFHAFYDPLVFGGGTVSVVVNSAQFANSIGGCLAGQVDLVGLEVNQAIQDWNNSIQPLIQDKTTYVRAHVQPVGTDPTRAFGLLYGQRDGLDLPGSPLAPVNPGGSIVAEADAAARRGEWDGSLNFKLPGQWLNGTIDLRVETAGNQIQCSEAAGSPDDCSVQVTFETTNRLEVEFVGIRWTDANGDEQAPSPNDMLELARRLRAIFPIASGITGLDWRMSSINWNLGTPDPLELINLRLKLHRLADGCFSLLGCNRIYYGVITGPVPLSGLANNIPGIVASGVMPADPYEIGRNVHAHEFGHTLNRHHAVHPPVIDPIPLVPWDNYKAGWCGEAADDSAPNFPYSAVIGAGTRATIGPMNSGTNALVYGLDTHIIEGEESSRHRGVIDPNDHFELMSYCGNFNNQFQWISPFTYFGLREYINSEFSSTADVPDFAPLAIQEYWVVRGVVSLNDNTVDLLPLTSIFSPMAPPNPTPGEYSLSAQILDSAGNILDQVIFEPDRSGDHDELLGTFAISFPKYPDAVEVEIWHDGSELANIVASQSVPTIEVVWPNGGEVLSEDEVELLWNAADADGDALTFMVQYSADAGLSWKTLITDWDSTSYILPLSNLAGSDSGLIRVTTSDGFNNSTDVSDSVFQVPNHAPVASIASPSADDLFLGTQLISFAGEAYDREDGVLQGSAYEWYSDQDGLLGTGSPLSLSAAQLSEGVHTITLAATDSDGLTGSDAVEIHVYRVAPPETAGVISAFVSPTMVNMGGTVRYQVDLEITGAANALGVSILADLPQDFDYVPGSTSGVTASDPVIQGQRLVWPAAFLVSSGDTISVSFRVRVNANPGEYTASFEASGANLPILQTGDAAPLTVRAAMFLPAVFNSPPPINAPPYTPSDESPPHGAAGQAINLNLSWTGGDYDGDDVSYDVYLEAGDASPDALVCGDVTVPVCDPGTLSHETLYYWQVIATDEHGATAASPVWIFTTGAASASCTNLVLNSGFEYNGDWERPITEMRAEYTNEQAHSGLRSMKMGITDPLDNVYSYSSARQIVSIPADPISVTLEFWLYPMSTETANLSFSLDPLNIDSLEASSSSDSQMVLILDPVTEDILGTLQMMRSDAQEWVEYAFDLIDYSGSSVKLYFGTFNNGTGGVTSMYVDDVFVEVCPE